MRDDGLLVALTHTLLSSDRPAAERAEALRWLIEICAEDPEAVGFVTAITLAHFPPSTDITQALADRAEECTLPAAPAHVN